MVNRGEDHNDIEEAASYYETVPVSPEQHALIKAEVLRVARKRVDDLPVIFGEIQQVFRNFHPKSVLSIVAWYALKGAMAEDGSVKRLSSGLEQHHVELLQAVMLTIPYIDWSISPPTPNDIQVVFDKLPQLSETLFADLLLTGQDIEDPQQKVISSLQARIRFHTQAVRNWGYHSKVVSLSQALYSPLDAAFCERVGFGATEMVQVAAILVAEVERRARERLTILHSVAQEGSLIAIARKYYELVPDLDGEPEELIETIPNDLPLSNFVSMVISHLDLRLSELCTFEADEVASLACIDHANATNLLNMLSMHPGELETYQRTHLFLANPVWLKPVVRVGNQYFLPMPQIILSHVHAVVRQIAEQTDTLDKLDGVRNQFLESRLAQILKSALPGAAIISNFTWRVGAQTFETDAVALLDKTLIIAEAKANHLTPQGLRGAPERVRRHIRDLLVAPSIQSGRLAELITAANLGDHVSATMLGNAGLDVANVKEIVRISVTLDDFSVLSSCEHELRETGWLSNDMELAPVVNIADFECICDVLRPVEFIHYFQERNRFQKSVRSFGDELDFLGLYLDCSMNIAEMSENILFSHSGMSELIDRYYMAQDAGISLEKPRLRMAPYWRAILDHLQLVRPDGWTLFGAHLLQVADPDGQEAIVRDLEKLRLNVLHKLQPAILTVVPTVRWRLPLLFYVHAGLSRDLLVRGMEQAASQIFAETLTSKCLVIARHAGHWEQPYQSMLIASS